MVSLNIDASTPLKSLIQVTTPDTTIYVNGALPSSNLPEEFILIEPNGGIRTVATKFGNALCTISVSLYVKLLTTGQTNTVKEDILIGKFQSLFADSISTTSGDDKFLYELGSNPVVYSGRSLVSGYSTKVINVNCFINY